MEQWILRGGKAAEFSEALGVGKLVGKVLSGRMSLEVAREFLKDDIPLSDPFLLPDMSLALPLIEKHLSAHNKIRIIGDYDVDGVTSTAILVLGLRAMGANVDFCIPERIGEGYGFSVKMAEACVRDGIALVITCDTGIREFERASYLSENHVDLIVTDHHEIEKVKDDNGIESELLPSAASVINAKRRDSTFPFSEICGAYTAYLLIAALSKSHPIAQELANKLISYATLATICDIMPLVGENRRLVKKGLKILNENPSQGVKALKAVSSTDKIGVYQVGYQLGPLLNSGGRLSSQNLYVQILLSEDKEECERLANELFVLNKERQAMTEKGLEQGILQTEADNNPVKVIYLPETHESIVGLIAGKLKEKYSCPFFVVTKAESGLKGSGRSIETYSMFEKMCEVSEIFTKFGGHPMAAGFSLVSEEGKEEEAIANMRRVLNERSGLSEKDLYNRVGIDAVIAMEDFSYDDYYALSFLEPFGNGNETPLFAQKRLQLLSFREMGKDGNTLKLKLQSGYHVSEAMLFRKSDLVDIIGESVFKEISTKKISSVPVFLDICYQVQPDTYHGGRNLTFIVKKLRKSI